MGLGNSDPRLAWPWVWSSFSFSLSHWDAGQSLRILTSPDNLGFLTFSLKAFPHPPLHVATYQLPMLTISAFSDSKRDVTTFLLSVLLCQATVQISSLPALQIFFSKSNKIVIELPFETIFKFSFFLVRLKANPNFSGKHKRKKTIQ